MTTTESHQGHIAPSGVQKTRPSRARQTTTFLLACLLCVCAPVFAGPPLFTLAKLSDDPVKQLKELNQMSDAMASALTAYGYQQGQEAVFANLTDLRDSLERGETDLVTTTLYEAAELMRSGHAIPLALKWKKELPRYSSLIVVRKDSGISSLQELAGKRIAFEDELSTSAFFVPSRAIMEAGLTLEPMAEASTASSVQYRFSGSEQNSSALLFRGNVDAASMSDYDWLKDDHVPRAQRDQFDIIHVSEALPRGIEMVRANMPDDQRQVLLDFLLGMHLDPAQENALQDYHETSRFSRLSDVDLQQLQEAVSYLKSQDRHPGKAIR